MSAAAKRLGTVLGRRIQAAADARWLTTGVVTGTEPLMVTVDERDVPAGLGAGYSPTAGDVVVVAVLRGDAAVGYTVLGTMTPSSDSYAYGPVPRIDDASVDVSMWVEAALDAVAHRITVRFSVEGTGTFRRAFIETPDGDWFYDLVEPWVDVALPYTGEVVINDVSATEPHLINGPWGLAVWSATTSLILTSWTVGFG